MSSTNTQHHLGDSPNGLFTAVYNDGPGNVTIYSDKAKGWKYLLDDAGTLAHFLEIAEAFTDATGADLRWLGETLASVETWLETCPHDLARFGEIGISY